MEAQALVPADNKRETMLVEEMSLADSEKRLKLLEARRALVLRTLNVTDVAKLGDALAKNKYAAEKLHEVFGGTFEFLKDNAGKPFCDVEIIRNDPDVGEVRIYTLFGRYTRPDGKVIEQMGSFSTKDPFFAKEHDTWKRIDQINLVDIMVAAQTETYKKCIFRGCGLGDWTDEEAQRLSDARGHQFGAKAGGARDSDVTMSFGKAKGKRVGELSDSDLDFYVAAYKRSVADPEKSKWRDANERTLASLQAEVEARKAQTAAAQPEKPKKKQATAAPADEPKPADKPKTIGDKRQAVSRLLMAATEGKPVRSLDLLKAVAPGVETVSECPEPELDRILDLPASELAATVEALMERE